MQLLKSSAAELAPEFGIMAGRWSQYPELGGLPFGAMWCQIAPGERSNPDCHPERELVVVMQGTLHVQASGRDEVAPAGAAVLLDSTEEHVLVNPSAQDPVVMLSIYWLPEEDNGQATAGTGQ
jgi:quercetin dioxygenase-like cupin family protein